MYFYNGCLLTSSPRRRSKVWIASTGFWSAGLDRGIYSHHVRLSGVETSESSRIFCLLVIYFRMRPRRCLQQTHCLIHTANCLSSPSKNIQRSPLQSSSAFVHDRRNRVSALHPFILKSVSMRVTDAAYQELELLFVACGSHLQPRATLRLGRSRRST